MRKMSFTCCFRRYTLLRLSCPALLVARAAEMPSLLCRFRAPPFDLSIADMRFGDCMNKTFSKDGTLIAFDRSGKGPPVILVDGALCYRASGPSRPLASLLARDFTVFAY